ncbi:hypothetical protein [Streptomyces graminofaciens]|uniref:hypothetical protein n=1 Tax=Streptomyces graminofaciens TaxID=68212 RepID=UPI0025744970|nr:hypothetical protein [Streptomyces graminofaciens]
MAVTTPLRTTMLALPALMATPEILTTRLGELEPGERVVGVQSFHSWASIA